jgi:hypothetical protein
MEIVDAAAHLEEVQGIVGEFFRGGTRREGTIVERFSTQTAQAGCDRGARLLIFQVQIEQWGDAQAQAVALSFRKNRPERAIQKKAGFEV